MPARFRIPITAITVFGVSSLLAVSIGIVLYLGFSQAAETTRQLWSEQSKTLIDSMQHSLDARLAPIQDQAQWVAADIHDLSNPARLDDYIFGVLAATPQVAGVAIITVDGRSRRWHRKQRIAIDEDWSQKPWFNAYMEQVQNSGAPAWRRPIFTETINETTLLHDIPLRNADGEFIGIFAQIIPVHEISSLLSEQFTASGVTPFILYDRNQVLAHPSISDKDEHRVLPGIDELGDPVLDRIWTPDENAPFISRALVNTRASGIYLGNDFYLYLYRDVEHYGPAPWTIGAHLNMSLLSGERRDRMMNAMLAGFAVLVIAIFVSIAVGRRVSSPVQAMVRAASAVEAGKLETIAPLGGSRIRELDDAGTAFNSMVRGLRERKLIRDTLGRFVPEKVASSLLAGGGNMEVQQSQATILFCDIEAFTQLTEALGPVKIVDVLNAYFSAMVDILENHNGVVTQFQGDAILATFNVPVADPRHAANAILAAKAMLDCVANNDFLEEKLNIRIGVNTGSVVAGAIGARGRLNYTVHGDAVNLAARLEALNKEHGTRLLISESSAALAEEIDLNSIGEVTVRGQTRATRLYTLATCCGEE